MEAVLQSFLAGTPVLLLHVGVTVLMLVIAVRIYTWITPYDEFQLVREGNHAAAISLGGATFGMALPLAICMAASINIPDIVLWGSLTLVIQLAAYKITDWILRDLPKRIVSGEIGAAFVLIAIKLSFAVINAAAISG